MCNVNVTQNLPMGIRHIEGPMIAALQAENAKISATFGGSRQLVQASAWDRKVAELAFGSIGKDRARESSSWNGLEDSTGRGRGDEAPIERR